VQLFLQKLALLSTVPIIVRQASCSAKIWCACKGTGGTYRFDGFTTDTQVARPEEFVVYALDLMFRLSQARTSPKAQNELYAEPSLM
jgi:hypothetical protein